MLTGERTVLERRRFFLRLVLFVIALSTLLLLGRLLYDDAPAWQPGLALLATVAVLRFYLRNRRERDRLHRLVTLYDRALARVDGSAPQSGHTGEQFRTAAHLYDRDLAILGPDSLFGLLAITRTGVGQRGLARDLLEPHTREATLGRQIALQELASRLDLRETIALLGVSDFQQLPATFFDTWLDAPPPTFHPALRPALLISTIGYLFLTLAGVLHLASWAFLRPNIALLLVAQTIIALSVRKRVVPLLNSSSRLSNQMQIFRDGIALLQFQGFRASDLVALQRSTLEPANAVPAIARIQRQFVVVEQRAGNLSLVVSLLLCAGTHAALSIAAWKRQHATALKQWLAAWAEFESLNALATYAFEHPENTYPKILPEGAAVFEATALAHPLLPGDAVPNDIRLDPAQSLYLISGSNMAGKSTLLRAIGLNAVLAAVGAPIRAASARISPLRIGASLALTDSLAEGKSKFLAEVERLHAILKLAEHDAPVLFLIDEIFSGTNSLDRRVAAEAVARALMHCGAIGALSTHDLTLTEMAADPALRAANVHMASLDPADPLAFDYRLRPGVNPSSNALAILRLIGIDLP